jgi:hypothetical protein
MMSAPCANTHAIVSSAADAPGLTGCMDRRSAPALYNQGVAFDLHRIGFQRVTKGIELVGPRVQTICIGMLSGSNRLLLVGILLLQHRAFVLVLCLIVLSLGKIEAFGCLF